MGHVLEFDKERYIAAARVLEFPLPEYNDVLVKLIELNGYVSLTELSCTHKVSRSIRGAGASCAGLEERQLITRDLDALYPSHRSHPAVYHIDYERIEQEALSCTEETDAQLYFYFIQQQRKTLMSYNNTDGDNGKYSAQFRKDAKTKNKNGQNIVSHTSIIEQGRLAKHTRAIANMYEEMDTSNDCPVHSRVNRPCDCEE